MALVSFTDAQLAFGHYAMLDHADFSLEIGERVGLIGRNGTGKSSMLRIIAGQAKLDDGLLVFQQGIKVAYVAQEPTFPPGVNVFDAVAEGLSDIQAMLAEFETLAEQLASSHDDAMLSRLNELQSRLEAADAWNLNNRVETTLAQLGLAATAQVDSLSGGMQKRVALARGLVTAPDVLLLDEPTNHLDVEAILWLENLLREFRGSILLITHDRSFLDNVSTRIVELDRGKLLSYPGNFSKYKQLKAEQLAVEAVENAKFDKFLAEEEVWIRKGIEARRTRNEGRVRRLEDLRLQRAARRDQLGQVKMEVAAGERSGRIVAELQHVSKAFGDKTIVNDFSALIQRGDKVGFIGANGTGKTTLLKLILGELQPDTGSVRLGANLQVAYFDQMRAQLNEDTNLVDTISPGSEWIEIGGQKKHVMSYLGDFLFSPERARSPVKSLSGGERNRLLLARLFARPANVLVLDEPTNDLDIDTLELLEELLEDYNGTVFLVSHDRMFVDDVVTQVIAFEGDGFWREYVGGYSDWVRARPAPVATAQTTAPKSDAPKKSEAPAAQQNTPPAQPQRKKLSYKEQRALEELPKRIAELEAEQKILGERLADPELYRQQPDEIKQLNDRFAQIDDELLECLERWEDIESRSQG